MIQFNKPQLLITGANGFVGNRLCEQASKDGWPVRRAVRLSVLRNDVSIGDLRADTDWSIALNDIETIVHLAARVHIMSDISSNPLEEFRKVNTSGTLNLARQAAELGIKRFIYLSSIKVNGEETQEGVPFTPNDIFVPTDPYALSKYEAEQGLLNLAAETEMEIVIIRSPLVYGPKVKANFLSMMKWQNKGVPLPFGAIHNKRSLIALDNLVDLIITCIKHPCAANKVFLVSDDEDISTSELLTRVSNTLEKRTWLLPINQKVLEFCLGLIGRKDLARRLFSSLQVDISKTKNLLNWIPPITVDEGLRKAIEHYMESEKLR